MMTVSVAFLLQQQRCKWSGRIRFADAQTLAVTLLRLLHAPRLLQGLQRLETRTRTDLAGIVCNHDVRTSAKREIYQDCQAALKWDPGTDSNICRNSTSAGDHARDPAIGTRTKAVTV